MDSDPTENEEEDSMKHDSSASESSEEQDFEMEPVSVEEELLTKLKAVIAKMEKSDDDEIDSHVNISFDREQYSDYDAEYMPLVFAMSS